MEPPVPRSRGRPRKRRNNDLQDGNNDAKSALESCKRTLMSRPVALVGRYLLKEFKGSGKFIGKVVYYEEGLYRVVYEDGDNEDLESGEIRGLLIGDPHLDNGLSKRKKRLDELALRFNAKNTNVARKNMANTTEKLDPVGASVPSKLSSDHVIENDAGEVEADVDSSSDSFESGDGDCECEDESLLIPPPHFPPSSGTIGIQEQHVSHLLSVYGFLRSFSFRLFLFPFSLDDFVGSLNCGVANTLLDSIHVALMRALRRHLESLSSDGLEIASKCLRHFNWSLLDSLTWPVYLVQYLIVMGHAKGLEWNGFYKHALSNEYYSIPTGRKLMVLQILCDEVLESGELRAEIDTHEISEVGLDYDAGAVCLSENGPRRVHPRYPKTSACMDGKAMEIIVEGHGMQSYTDQNILGSKGGTNGDLDAAVDSNRNSDECRLCGMDGSLLCCDGCPSAYHLRCIGMMKILIPQGPWYCPECSINKTEPAITKGSSLRGAETFGIDPHEHIFLGSCNHLVVLKTSINSEPRLKYYNQNDILNVLHVLCSSSQYIGIYYGICKAIMQYWDIPENLLVLPEASGMDVLPANLRKDNGFYVQSLPAGEEEHEEPHVHEDRKDLATCKSENDSKVVPYFGIRDPPAHSTNGFIIDSLTSNYSTSQSQNGGLLGHGKVKGDIKAAICCAYIGSRFKPQGYVNHYVHGEFAASAAHKLDVLSAEETRVLGTHASDSKRSSSASAYALLQAKAFSLSASRFIWPTFDKKLMEVPRERCGWCLSCRAAVLSKRGCLLNHAALTATRGAMKILSSLRLGKNGEGNLSCIAGYVLYMEESLRGLVGGTFLSASYRKQWRHQLESAFSCSLIKLLLLELEENIRCIALSGNWFKLVDDWCLETSMSQNAPSAVGTTVQKRGPGRRSRKQSVSEVPSPDRSDANFLWFRGGLSKLVFQRAALSRRIVAKAARQGGSRKISGIHYTDGSEIPRRSRQLVWRAAVEASKNVSQLALQLRNLDFHLRWNDLVRPEQTLDIKGQETEASIFRNARINDKKVVENKITYGVAFGSQKHLPSRVMKNVIEIEQKQDGRVAYWFSENCIPLYLVKEYEEASIQVNLPSSKVYQNLLYRSRSRWLKSYQRDIFFYLTCRRDTTGLLSCSSCRLELLLRNAVKCSSCQEYCHVNCTVRSTISGTEDALCAITCKQCCHLKALNHSGNSTESPTSPLPLQDKEHRSSTTARKSARPKGSSQPSVTPVNKVDTRCEKKQATPGSSAAPKSKRKNCSWGVIWKKKNCEDTGANFRHNFLLLKGGWELHHMKPICHLCSKPYRSDLMYICCETCNNWYHAEAVELEESKILDVVGYKCCRCRRIKSPECPYMDPKPEKQEGAKKTRTKSTKQENSGVECVDLTIPDSKKLETSSPLLPKEEEDPFVFSHSRVELITEPNSGLDDDWNIAAAGQAAPQKLRVRRQTKPEDDTDGFYESSLPSISIQHETDALSEWGSSAQGLEEAVAFDFDSLNYEDMDFGPQTYFSFTELLEPDDVEFGGIDPSRDASGDVDNSLSIEDIDIFNHGSIQQLEPAVSIPAVNCQMCTNLEPVPNLACQVCGLQIHSHCSPWDDEVTMEENWSCGRCREWQ